MRAAEGEQRNEVRSRSNLYLAPSSELHYLGRLASRQSSLPINRDCQQTATNYLLYQSRTYTEHQIFFAFHKLLKRYMKAQQLVQCMVPRALFGGVWNTSKSVYSSGSQLLLSRPSVGGAYLKKYTRKSTTRGISYTVSSTYQLLSFSVRSRSGVCFPLFFLPSNHFARQNLCRTHVLGSARQIQLTDRKK